MAVTLTKEGSELRKWLKHWLLVSGTIDDGSIPPAAREEEKRAYETLRSLVEIRFRKGRRLFS